MKSPRVVKPQTELLTTPICPIDPEHLQWITRETQLELIRRAYELFEARGGEHGHDWEDWFRAESELLRPVSITLSETEEHISVCANVLGFDHNDLKVAVEPRRLTVFGKKSAGATDAENAIDRYSVQILRLVELPVTIDPRGAVIVLRSGVLSFELPKAQAAAQAA
jgi:HSP20 family protein